MHCFQNAHLTKIVIVNTQTSFIPEPVGEHMTINHIARMQWCRFKSDLLPFAVCLPIHSPYLSGFTALL